MKKEGKYQALPFLLLRIPGKVWDSKKSNVSVTEGSRGREFQIETVVPFGPLMAAIAK